MKKEIIVLGDIEMGAGNLTDDFISDKTLSKLILELAKRNHPVDLILNGDTFDFLKCPYIKDGKRRFLRHITQDISLAKLDSIYNAHTRVFKALAKFAKKDANKIFFIIGNHDHDLFFQGVRTQIRKYLGGTPKNITFPLEYSKHGVYAEHGHQYDFTNRINRKYPFLTFRGQKILNYPWLALGIMTKMMMMKEEHPFAERIVPYPVLLTLYKTMSKKLSWRSIRYIILSIIYYPIRYITDPTYTLPWRLLRQFIERIKNFNWDVPNIGEVFLTKKQRILKKHKIVVLGHDHLNYIQQKDESVVIHPDTWRDEYLINRLTRKVKLKTKNYVKIEIRDDDSLDWELVEVKIKRSVLDFDKIIRDEKMALAKAAAEEGFIPSLI